MEIRDLDVSAVQAWLGGDEQDTALVCIDATGMITLAARTADLLGIDDQRLPGRPAEVVFEQPQILAGVGEVPGGGATLVQTRCLRADGDAVLVEASLAPVCAVSGTQVQALLRPAVQRRRDVVTRGLLASLAVWSNDVVIASTLDGEIAFWNPAAQRMYGYTAEEMIGAPVTVLYDGDPGAELDRWMPQVTGGQTVRLDAVRRRHRDGRLFSCAVTLAPVVDESGTVVGVASLTHPAESSRPGDARFRALLEAVTIAIIGVDDRGRIVMLNTAAERLFGYPAAQLTGEPVDILVPAAVRARHAGLRDTYLADPQTRPMGTGMVLFAQHRDGHQIPVEVSLAPISGDDGLMIAVSVLDMGVQVTNERLERQLQHARRLESIGQLAGGVAHGFNNLIGVVDGYSRFIHQTASEHTGGDPASPYTQIAADADRVVDAAARAAALARQLLAFARSEQADTQHLDLNHAVRDATELLRRSLGEHVVIAVHLSDEPQPVLADPGQIEQIIMNAAVNARDAMPQGGTLTVDTSRVTLDAADAHQRGIAAGGYVRLRITDTGTGIPPDIAAKVFEPFYTTKPAGEGTGLGLSTIYGIVTGYGGHATLYSEPGHGTTLSLLIPLDTTPGQPTVTPPAAPAGNPQPGKHTILVVDDEEFLRDLVARQLTNAGHHVLTAADGPTAITVADQHPGNIDLLITDVIMPKMLGTAVAAHLTARRPGLPVIYMSGYAQPALNAQGTLGDDATLLEKPFTDHHLHTAVTTALNTTATTPAPPR